MLKLTILTDADAGREFTPEGDVVVIGRSNRCDVMIDDPIISRRHCQIEKQGFTYVLTDLQSGNGTFVNDDTTCISTHVLASGDVIAVGQTRLRAEFAAQADDAVTTIGPLPGATPPSVDRPRTVGEPAPGPPPMSDASLAAVRQPDVPIVVTVVSGPDHGQVYSPAREAFTIGRAETADVVLHDRRVSRFHISIKREHGKYRVYDEKSANGTFLRTPDNRIFHSDLTDGDVLYIGKTQLRVEVRTKGLTPVPTEDATIVSGMVAGKSFSFTLNALGASGRRARTDERTRVGELTQIEKQVDNATRVAPLSAPSMPQITLHVVGGQDGAVTFTPPPGTERFTIGRGEQADFRIEDRRASRVHATIEQMPSGFVVLDNESLNGTFLNEAPERVTRAALRAGEEIRIGETRLKVEITGMMVPPPAVADQPAENGTTFLPPPPRPDVVVPESLVAPIPVTPAQSAVEVVRSRSEAFKERLAAIARQKGISLRPFTLPGSPRHWATLLFMLIAAVLSYGFVATGRVQSFSGGPLIERHAKWEAQCATCHPEWGFKPINATCVTTKCHATVLNTEGTARDNCVQCHTEHRGRTFDMSGGEQQCWNCHKAGLGVREFALRPLQSYSKDVFALAAQTVPQAGKIARVQIEPAALQANRQRWLSDFAAQPTGLKYGHAIHTKDVLKQNNKQEQCQDCHVKLPEKGVSVFPTHAECIECHKEVVDRDPKVAKVQASEKCEKCHTSQEGGVARIERSPAFVNFRHDDHGITRCIQCHAVVTTEEEYRPVLRSASAYPMPMDACYTCHKERNATLACLDCHRSHHSFPPLTTVASGWLTGLSFSGVLLCVVVVISGAVAYTYAETRVSLRWLESAEQATAESSPDASADAGSASGQSPGPVPMPVGDGGILPFPTVDAATCISCSSCYDSCPTQVLAGDPVSHKSEVVNASACIALEGCTICQDGCPTGAIRVTSAPLVKETERPQIDRHNESNLPGLFLVGEVVGAALIKKAVNQGDQTVRYIFNRRPRVAAAQFDVIIVGAGPSGLAAGLEAQRLGLRYVVLERETLASTIQNYPRDKAVLAEPVLMSVYGLLPMKDTTKEALVVLWEEIVRKSDLRVNTREEVTAVTKEGALFTVTTVKGTYVGSDVVLATGTRGNPRKIGSPGEDLPKVAYNLIDAGELQGKKVLVVGGGDSAIEAAVALAKEPGTTVSLSYRRGEFSRIKSRNADAIVEQEKAGRVTVLFNSQVEGITPTAVTLKVGNELRTLENDAVFALIGADPPKAWLQKIGVNFVIVKETLGGQW